MTMRKFATGKFVAVVSEKGDWELASTLAILFLSDDKAYHVYTESSWKEIRETKPGARPDPVLVAWRISSEQLVSHALFSIRKQAQILSPICFYGVPRPDVLDLFSDDVSTQGPWSYWWLESSIIKFGHVPEILCRIERKMPPDWPTLVVPESTHERAEMQIRHYCQPSELILRVFHGFSRYRSSPDDIDKYMEGLRQIRFILGDYASIELIRKVDELLEDKWPSKLKDVLGVIEELLSTRVYLNERNGLHHEAN
ncbi:MAG: hypothetical protein NT178_18475 [Proteobacteria bacterium]|nr:hypothetical protein [Pseudomonadota bacterium]